MTFNNKRNENFQYPHSDPLFRKLGILKIQDIKKLCLTKFVYKFFDKCVPDNFHNWFTLISQVHQYNTRMNFNLETSTNTNKLYVPFRRTSRYGFNQIKVQAAKLWNDLPEFIKQRNNLHQFSNVLKKFMISNYSPV